MRCLSLKGLLLDRYLGALMILILFGAFLRLASHDLLPNSNISYHVVTLSVLNILQYAHGFITRVVRHIQ